MRTPRTIVVRCSGCRRLVRARYRGHAAMRIYLGPSFRLAVMRGHDDCPAIGLVGVRRPDQQRTTFTSASSWMRFADLVAVDT